MLWLIPVAIGLFFAGCDDEEDLSHGENWLAKKGDWKSSPIGHGEHVQNNGAQGCTTCHTEQTGCLPCHGDISTYTPPKPTQHFCGTCHLTDQNPRKSLFSPLNTSTLNDPHQKHFEAFNQMLDVMKQKTSSSVMPALNSLVEYTKNNPNAALPPGRICTPCHTVPENGLKQDLHRNNEISFLESAGAQKTDQGQTGCINACHKQEAIWFKAAQPYESETSCTFCHANNHDISKKMPPFSNGIVFKNEYNNPFEITKEEAETTNKLCMACHKTSFDAQGKLIQPHPDGQVTLIQNSCAVCHQTQTTKHQDKNKFKATVDSLNNCSSCHGYDPRDSSWPPKITDQVYPSKHGNNQLDFVQDEAVLCNTCHAYPGTSGAHAKHLALNYSCTTCHENDGPVRDANGLADMTQFIKQHQTRNHVVFGGLAFAKLHPADMDPVPDYKEGTCSNTSCHSPVVSGGNLSKPLWDGAVVCGSCHAIDASLGSIHAFMAPLVTLPKTPADHPQCGLCHPTNDTLKHVNGQIDLN